jgi:uncharacterized repeat protein (TIGR02543 family)
MDLLNPYGLALTSNHQILVWGHNQNGQLGTSHANKIDSATQIMPNMVSELKTLEYIVEELLNFTTPILEGYTFDGWYTDIELTIPFEEVTMPEEDITLYAKFIVND